MRWRVAAAVFWIANGSNHFLQPKFYKSIVPPPLDRWKGPVNVAAGMAELTGGAAILPSRTRTAARWWLLATLVAVFPANIHMALQPEKFERGIPGGRNALYARLPVQLLFIAWAYAAGDWD
jgi:uncharacterized membrane protein